MNRQTQRKLSRALVSGLGLTIALGGVFWLGKIVGSSSSSDSAASQEAREARVARGETTEATIAANASGARSGTSVALAPATTTQPAAVDAGSPFNARLASANVLQTPTAPLASAATTQPSLSSPTPPILAAATTRPANSAGAGVQFAARNNAPDALLTGNALADAKMKIEHGKLLDARRILNAAITGGQLSDADVKAAKQKLNEINAIVIFSSKQFAEDEYGGTFTVPPGGVLEKIAKSHDISKELLQRINGITDPRKLRAQQSLKVISGPFNAVVDKSDFSLELWIGEPGAKGAMYVTSFPVGLGENDSTPTGVWAVKNRLTNPAYFSPRGEGITAADDPKNPLGEYWIGLTGSEGAAVGQQSYGIHGTIDPASIGKQSSMGCIRLKNEDVAKVFETLVEGKSTVAVKE
ncbi:MAG: hypothetical protein QOF78_3624 [Phycisphaerales bacterium]|jgi:lipoprotein-anchoring transpeptidase ErfK/SrfK|nr:hypothetical protein [Phycisphaerales bacterium]